MMSNGISLIGRDRVGAFAGRIGEQQIFEEHVGLAVEHAKPGVDRGHADCLGDVALANAGVAEQQNVFVLFDEPSVGQFEDERAIERIELPIERIERSLVAKAGGFDASLDEPVSPSLQLVMHEQADEVERSEVLGSRLLRPDRNGVGHSAKRSCRSDRSSSSLVMALLLASG